MSFRKTALAFFAWSIFCLSPIFAQDNGELAQIVTNHPSELLNDLNSYALIRLEEQTRANAAAAAYNEETFVLDLGEGPLELLLRPMEMRAQNYQRLTTDGQRYRPTSPTTQFHGTVFDGGKAIFTIAPTFLMGQWEIDGETYWLEPLWFSAPAAPPTST